MNSLYRLWWVLLLTVGSVLPARAQFPCDWGITTDPDAPTNPQRPAMTNTLDWRTHDFDVNSSYYPVPFDFVDSPFWNNYSKLDYLWDVPDADKDYQPADGWEIVKFDFGYALNGSPSGNAELPYLILYNKYSAVLRVLATIGDGAVRNYDAINIQLRFRDPEATDGVTALLSPQGELAQPLDQYTEVSRVVTPSPFSNSSNLFVHADFPVAYDPCTCHLDNNLELTFMLVNKMEVNLYGRAVETTVPPKTASPLACCPTTSLPPYTAIGITS